MPSKAYLVFRINERTICEAKHETSSVFKIGRSPPPPVDLPVDLNGNFRFLLLELIWADQLADLPPHRSASDWQLL